MTINNFESVCEWAKTSTTKAVMVILTVFSIEGMASSQPVQAQSRQETTSFLFNGMEIAGWAADLMTDRRNITISENNCVITVDIKITKENIVFGDSPLIVGLHVSAVVDFNKLTVSSGEIRANKDGDVTITIPGEGGATIVHGWDTNRGSRYFGSYADTRRDATDDKIILHFSGSDAPRAENALRYFVRTFCAGNGRAF